MSEIDNDAVGLALRAIRESKGLSAKDLSIASDFQEYFVSRIETGKMRLFFSDASRLVKVLGVTLNDLLEKATEISGSERFLQLRDLKTEAERLKSQLARERKFLSTNDSSA